jgi:hypothetical protein
MKETRLIVLALVTALLAFVLTTCGGDNSSSTTTAPITLSAQSSAVLAQQIAYAGALALGSTQFSQLSNVNISEPANLDHQELPSVQSILPDENPANRHEELSRPLQSVQCTQPSCTITQEVSSTTNCTPQGNIQVTGNISGTIDINGNGVLQIQATETLNDWSCLTGYLIEGDPNISLTGQLSFLNGSPAAAQTMTLSGGFTWTTTVAPPVETGSCAINLTANYQSNNGHGVLSGTVCGYSVNNGF